jgi:hypothetical protein
MSRRLSATSSACASSEKEEQRQRGQELRQFAMDLGLGAERPAEPGLTVADRKALLEEELVAIKLGKARGELVAKASVEGAVAEVLVWHQQQTETFAARLSRRSICPDRCRSKSKP